MEQHEKFPLNGWFSKYIQRLVYNMPDLALPTKFLSFVQINVWPIDCETYITLTCHKTNLFVNKCNKYDIADNGRYLKIQELCSIDMPMCRLKFYSERVYA